MEWRELIACIDCVSITEDATITQLKRAEDGTLYQVWRIDTDRAKYILKEVTEKERENYQLIPSAGKKSTPALYQVVSFGEKTYMLMEYIEGEDLCKCNREQLTLALDALILLQENTWEEQDAAHSVLSSEKSFMQRVNRGKYLNDPLLEAAYGKYMEIYQSVPKALCHDDLLPFNVICSDKRACLIDWEVAGILPYPTSFARLIAHGEENTDAFFYMTQADKNFAIDYYYDNLLKKKGISYTQWRNTLEFFLFYEQCEWVFVGNKYDATDSEYYKKYLPIAAAQANKIMQLEI